MQFTIRFLTADIIPAPFCHEILAHFTIEPTCLQTSFQMVYTEREDMEDDEIYDEGFTLNDDFEWKGTLNPKWSDQLLKLWEKTAKTIAKKTNTENENYLEIEVNDDFNGRPVDASDWEYLLHELIQAVFETAGKEKFLQIMYRKVSEDKTVYDQTLNIYFKSRKAEVKINQEHTPKIILWEDAQKLVSYLFIGEFMTDVATKKAPTYTGEFINIGDGLWYEFGKSLTNPHGNKKYLGELSKKCADFLMC